MTDLEQFLHRGRSRWDELDGIVRSEASLDPAGWTKLSSLYRSLCADLAHARALDVTDDLQGFLDDLAARAHNRLYRAHVPVRWGLRRFVFVEVPREIRAQWRWVALAALATYGPWILCMALSMQSMDLAEAVLSAEQLRGAEEMYSTAPGRTFPQDVAMAGFYVFNNIGIAFRCFATGVLFGLGSLFFLVSNGAMIGTTFGHLVATGHGGNLLEFTCGHSAWELNGIVLAGAAGIRMGWALIDTGGQTRVGSLRTAGPILFRMIVGAALMIAVAAAIEGFWSASAVPRVVKWLFALVQVGIVGAWWFGSGRGEEAVG